MRRSVRFAAAVATAVSLLIPFVPLAAPASAATTGAGMVTVLVVLPHQEDVSALRIPDRAQRRTAVVRALRARAQADQAGLRSFLARRRADGQVANVVPLWIVNGLSVTASPGVIAELAARSDVSEIRPEVTIAAPQGTASPASSDPVEANTALVGAPALWELGFRGQGVVVANMDTGVDVSHPDLASRWRGGTNSWYDPNGQHPSSPVDVSGHGTWTMGTMVGGSAGGTAIGMAPDAQWIAVKIFNDRGTATSTGIHQGFQWLLDPDNNPATDDAPDVVDNSWTMSTAACSPEFRNDLHNLRAASILPVFAAGNYGPSAGTVMSPANDPEAFAVGATDLADAVSPESSRGPSACGQPVAPLLVAPGVDVRTTDLFGGYRTVSGTSIAAPHAAGALALLLSALPGLSADRQESALQAGALDLGPTGPDGTYGYGRLDTLAGYDWASTASDFDVSASPSSASTLAGGSVSYTVTVSGTNGFADDVSLSATGLSGSQASWTFSPAVVSGGSGTTVLSLTSAPTLPPGQYPVTITAQSGPITHTIPVMVQVLPAPDFTVAATPASRTVTAGNSTTYAIGVSALNGFTGDVALFVSGLPPAVGSAAVTPAAVTGAGTSQLAISTSPTAPPGTYALTVTGTSGSLAHSATVSLVVTPAPDFTLSASPSSKSVRRGQTASYAISTAPIAGFGGTVSLSLQGSPPGATPSFAPNPIAAPGSSTLAVKTKPSTPRGTYTLVVTGTSGSIVHTATVTLVVT